MSTLGMSCLWEVLPKPAGSSLGSSASPQPGEPRALCISAFSSEEPHSWEQGDLRLKKWTLQDTNLTAFKSCLMLVQHLARSSCLPARGS